ncbi:MAG: DNA replication and repair protein RecF, partial [Pseudomonadota bacterium]|nr:DNA replication and repair protein RecF [Pseudomonadota bacterium]
EAFRNLDIASFPFCPNVTALYGDNGSGKSSFIEALYYLSYGRSFRTSNANALICSDAPAFIIHADIVQNGFDYRCSVLREEGKTRAKINASPAPLSHIAKLFPTLFADSDTYRCFMGSSTYRRRMFDWLGFHVKPGYIETARKYNAVLKNRNAALKMCQDTRPWDALLIQNANELAILRKEIFEEFLVFYDGSQSTFLKKEAWVFSPGYEAEMDYAVILERNKSKDVAVKRTTEGAHTADWLYQIGGTRAKDVLSQGQQKTAFFHTISAMDRHMQSVGVIPFLLIDDYSAELDLENRALLHSLVFEREGQGLITSVYKPDLSRGELASMFHVKQGGLEFVR